MKSLKIFLSCLPMLLTCYASLGQASLPLDEKTGKTVYTEVVEVNGVGKADLYQRATGWFKTYFPNPASVIKEQDSEGGRIKGQHAMYIYKKLEDGENFKAGQVKYAIEIQVKDGRYKYTVDDIFKLATPKVYIEEWLKEPAPDKEARMGYLKQVDTQINEMIAKMKESLQLEKVEEKEDW